MAKTFNEFFVSIVKNLGINENLLPPSSSETRNVESIISKFENHHSIATIRNCFDKSSIFSFEEIVKTEVFKEIKTPDIKKGVLSSSIPTDIIKQFGDLFAIFITENFDLCLSKEGFPEILKLLKLLQFIRKQTISRKTTTDQLAFLSNISKNYDRIMHNQIISL